MPITDIIIVSVITLAFVTFAAVLAWGDHQTREIARASRERALVAGRAAALKKNIAAEETGRASAEKSKTPAKA